MVKNNYSKEILWLSINSDEMMRESMNSFIDFLNSFGVKYKSYASDSGSRVYMMLKLTNPIVYDGNHDFHKGMGEWVYYHPINILRNIPKVSDYDLLEDFSYKPYDYDAWR